jgi:Protein of unknown function (DUF3667)
MTNCENCYNQISENYCPNCGQSAKLKRIDKHYISHEFLHLLHFEKGFFYTIKALLLKPGDSIKEFLFKNRDMHMKPVPFLILTALLFTLVLHYTHVDKIYNDQIKLLSGKTKIYDILHWMEGHHGYANLLNGFFIALSIKLFYRKYQYNLFEIIVLLCFVIGQSTFLLTIITLFWGLLNPTMYQMIGGIVNLGYSTWAIGQFFDNSKIWGFIKSFFVITFGFLLTYLTVIVLGLTADFILKMLSNH